jgi:ABC-type molybdate transport system permease subunit
VLARVGDRATPFSAIGFSAYVAGSFLFGWLLGLAVVLKVWHLAHAPRWMIVSGVGYVSLMLPPTITGFALAWCTGRLARRGWGPASLSLAGAGVVGLVAGLLVL